jgi:hypothetical protein
MANGELSMPTFDRTSKGGTANSGKPTSTSNVLMLEDRDTGNMCYSLIDDQMAYNLQKLQVFKSFRTTRHKIKLLKDKVISNKGKAKLKVGKHGEKTIIKRYTGMSGNLNLWPTVMYDEPDDAKKIAEVTVGQRRDQTQRR